MVVFLFGRVERAKGGLTKAVLLRASMFAEAGWSTHLALVREAPELPEVLAELRAAGRLHPDVVVHTFPRERSRLPRAFASRVDAGQGAGDQAEQLAAWLDWMVSHRGAVVFGDSPLAVPALVKMRDPRAGRVYVMHAGHLASRAFRGRSADEVARGALTVRFRDSVDPHIHELDRIVTLTRGQRHDLALRYGSSLPLATIPHFAESAAGKPARPPLPGRESHVVLAMGRLSPGKHFDHAVKAMARVLAAVPDARLLLHGRGVELPRLQELARDLGIADRVEFAGYTNDPTTAMAHATCLLATSGREAMPLVLLECLAVGTPVVVYDVHYGPAEIVRDGTDGFLVPYGDIEAAADAVVRLLRDPALRARMSAAAPEVVQRFSRESYEEAWVGLASQLLAEKSG